MPPRIRVTLVDRKRAGFYQPLIDDYAGRIGAFVSFEEKCIRPAGDDAAAVKAEEEAILRTWPRSGSTAALSRRGEPLGNTAWHTLLRTKLETPPGIFHLFVGGSRGLSDQVLERADRIISLGPLTLAHRLARLVLYEQIYRALTVRAGMKYHKVAGPGAGPLKS